MVLEQVTSPLRGRDAQLATIARALEMVGTGVGRVVIIEGAAGLGKTSVLSAGIGRARSLGFRTGFGAADPGHSPVALAPLMEALLGGDDPLIPRMALGRREPPNEELLWLIQDIQSLLEREAMRTPLLICLDDLHWADAGCAFALRMLPQRLASVPIGWLVAARPQQGPPPIIRSLGELATSGAETISLAPLDAAAVAQIAWDVLGAPADSTLLDSLAAVQGNPYLLLDLLIGLRDEAVIRYEAGRAFLVDSRVPHRVEIGLQQRLARLTPTAYRVASVAASLGRQFTVVQVAALTNIPVAELLDPIQEVIHGGLFTSVGSNLAFQHDLARDAIRTVIPPAARRALDRQAADVLLASGALPVEVAKQLATSAEVNDDDAIRVLAAAADALAITDPSSSADIASRALQLSPERHALRGPLVARRTLSLFAAGRGKEARTFADTALRQSLPAEQEAEVRLGIASMFTLSADVRAENLRQALALPGLTTDVRARALALLFHNLIVAGRLDEALEAQPEVGAGVTSSTDRSARYTFEIGLSGIAYQTGHFDRSLVLIDDIQRRRIVGVDDPRERLAHNYRSWILDSLDRVEEAAVVSDEGLAAAQRDRQYWAVHMFECWRGRHLLQMGRLDEANAALEGRFALPDAHMIVGILDAASLVALGRVKLHRGDDRAVRDIAAIAEVMLTTSAPAVRKHASWYLAMQAAATAGPDAAHHWLCALGKEERLELFPLFPVETADHPHLVRIAVAVGDEELARTVTELAQGRHEMNPGVCSLEAIAAHCRGLLENSVDDLSRAVSLLDSGPRPLALAFALEDLGLTCLAHGLRDDAGDALSRALALTVATGATRDAARVRGRLRDLGIRRRTLSFDRPKTGWEALTEAEQQVARLAAEGLTNRAIGVRLFVSPHTVNTHLRHIFEKLAVSSRVDLTHVVVQHPPDGAEPKPPGSGAPRT
jgi:DNA-binding CsgD family transcriptional regulator/tetratricopeptide (TPR) repeat protein